MGNNVFANMMEVSCKKADGKSICSFPDVCWTPPQAPPTPNGVPIPYPNTGMATDTTKGSRDVKITKKEVMLKNSSYFKKSMGDEAGVAPMKGLVTRKNRGKVYFQMWSMDVKIEGKNAVRMLDIMTHNHGSVPGNTPTWPYIDTVDVAAGDVVKEACKDDIKKEKEKCADKGYVDSTKKKRTAGAKDACKDAGLLAYPTDAADADAAKDRAAANECLKARKCMLVPYHERSDEGGCCPGQTGHHLVEAGSFFETGRGSGSKSKNSILDAAHPNKKEKYRAGKAPCICVEGQNQHWGSHGQMHSAQGHLNDRRSTTETVTLNNGDEAEIESLPYSKARENGCAAARAVFKDSECKPGCLEAQLDAYHKDNVQMSDTDNVRAIVTGDTSEDAVEAATGDSDFGMDLD